MHLGAWFTRLLFVSGTSSPPASSQMTPKEGQPEAEYSGFKKLEDGIRRHAGDQAFFLGSKVRAFFELLKDRESWKQTYVDGLH